MNYDTLFINGNENDINYYRIDIEIQNFVCIRNSQHNVTIIQIHKTYKIQ